MLVRIVPRFVNSDILETCGTDYCAISSSHDTGSIKCLYYVQASSFVYVSLICVCIFFNRLVIFINALKTKINLNNAERFSIAQ